MVRVKKYGLSAPDIAELLRYAGVFSNDGSLDAELEHVFKVCENKFSPRLCYTEAKVRVEGDLCVFSFASAKSADLAKYLKNCGKAVIFAATVGIEVDRTVRRFENTDSAAAVLADALGTERIEALCDAFCREIAEKKKIKPRFSPGYGDLRLDFQRDIFKVLECEKRIGLTLNESLMMSPGKSVTAVVGIENG